MNKRKLITFTFILLVSLSCIFASGVGEDRKEFSSLDFSTESIETIKESYENAKEEYSTQKEKLIESISSAYEKRDVKEYLELKELYNSLSLPIVTEEETETLITRMVNSSNEDEKKSISEFLYESSSYYKPTLTFVVEDGMRRFTKTIETKPGESVEAPEYYSTSATLTGWGITKDEITYHSGETLIMPYTSTVLYGILTKATTFEDSLTSYYYSTEDETVTVPELASPSEEYVFLGWYNNRGEELSGDTLTRSSSENLYYKAYWKALKTESYSVKYYDSTDSVDANTQLRLSIDLLNEGNTTLRDLKFTLESNDSVKVVNPVLNLRRLDASGKVSLNYQIVLKGESGESVTTTLTVTDGDGNEWTSPISFTIK